MQDNSEYTHVPSVISEFVSSYVDSLISGDCRDDQYAVAFRMQQGGSVFLAVDPDEAIERDPLRLAPKQERAMAHALFVPRLGRVSFTTPASAVGEVRHVQLEDPVYITIDLEGDTQLWMLSLAEDGQDDDVLSIHRADPKTVFFQSCIFDETPDRTVH